MSDDDQNDNNSTTSSSTSTVPTATTGTPGNFNSVNIAKLRSIASLQYRDQAIWFLNTCETTHDSESCELVWNMHKECVKIDKKKENGSGLSSDLDAHIVLEQVKSPVTQVELREFLNKIDPERTRRTIALVDIIFCYFKIDNWEELTKEDKKYFNQEALEKAKSSLKDAKSKLKQAVNAKKKSSLEAAEAQLAMERASTEEEEAREAEKQARKLEQTFSQSKAKAEVSLQAVNDQEDEYQKKMKDLVCISDDDSNGIVKRSKAKVELTNLRNEDPLPLRTAKINNEAAVRKLKKSEENSKKAAIAAVNRQQSSIAAQSAAESAKNIATEAGKEAEEAIPIAKEAFEKVKVLVLELMSQGDVPYGSLFYIDKETVEAEKYIPKSKVTQVRQAAEQVKRKLSLSPPKGRRMSDLSIGSLSV